MDKPTPQSTPSATPRPDPISVAVQLLYRAESCLDKVVDPELSQDERDTWMMHAYDNLTLGRDILRHQQQGMFE